MDPTQQRSRSGVAEREKFSCDDLQICIPEARYEKLDRKPFRVTNTVRGDEKVVLHSTSLRNVFARRVTSACGFPATRMKLCFCAAHE